MRWSPLQPLKKYRLHKKMCAVGSAALKFIPLMGIWIFWILKMKKLLRRTSKLRLKRKLFNLFSFFYESPCDVFSWHLSSFLARFFVNVFLMLLGRPYRSTFRHGDRWGTTLTILGRFYPLPPVNRHEHGFDSLLVPPPPPPPWLRSMRTFPK